MVQWVTTFWFLQNIKHHNHATFMNQKVVTQNFMIAPTGDKYFNNFQVLIQHHPTWLNGLRLHSKVIKSSHGPFVFRAQNSKSECPRAGGKNKIRASMWPKKERNADFLATSTMLSFGDLGKPPNA